MPLCCRIAKQEQLSFRKAKLVSADRWPSEACERQVDNRRARPIRIEISSREEEEFEAESDGKSEEKSNADSASVNENNANESRSESVGEWCVFVRRNVFSTKNTFLVVQGEEIVSVLTDRHQILDMG